MEEKICKINISELTSHPYNAKIYGINEDVTSLINDILLDGQSLPLIVNDRNIVISGNRRLKAFHWLVENGHTEFQTVKCIVRKYPDSESEIKDIITLNSTRKKNWEQIGREALVLANIYSKEAEKRMKLGKKADRGDANPQGQSGKTRDIVAEELKKKGVNVSGKIVNILIKAISAIDSKETESKNIDVFIIRRELTKDKPNFALLGKLVKNIDNLSDDEKDDIFNDRISLNKFFKRITEPSKINVEYNNTSYSNSNINEDADFKNTTYNSFGFRSSEIIDADFKEVEGNILKEVTDNFKQLISSLNEIMSKSIENPEINTELKDTVFDMINQLHIVKDRIVRENIKKIV